jgi:hypothetical protein
MADNDRPKLPERPPYWGHTYRAEDYFPPRDRQQRERLSKTFNKTEDEGLMLGEGPIEPKKGPPNRQAIEGLRKAGSKK